MGEMEIDYVVLLGQGTLISRADEKSSEGGKVVNLILYLV